jgi:DNA-binding transcriptional LysR family regulator
VHALIMRWLASEMPLSRAPMHLGTVEALKTAVTANLGMSIVPDVSVAEESSAFIVRPLRPSVPCTLALIEHRNKPGDPALDIVRKALLELRAGDGVAAPRAVGRRGQGRSRGASRRRR